MLAGVYPTKKKDGTLYFRASLTYRRKHISLGSFSSEAAAHQAYLDAVSILTGEAIPVEDLVSEPLTLSFDKAVSLLNFREKGLYFKTPIYLRANFFEYYLTKELVLKFDIDDLFFYSSHKIQRRGGHLFVSEYGMQTSLLSRYGIRAYAIAGVDYEFVNGDATDFRYSNIKILNAYYGVSADDAIPPRYKTKIHINGNFVIGVYETPEIAAIAYNKAVDLAKAAGIAKNYSQNYIESLSAKEYAEIYTSLPISEKYRAYLAGDGADIGVKSHMPLAAL